MRLTLNCGLGWVWVRIFPSVASPLIFTSLRRGWVTGLESVNRWSTVREKNLAWLKDGIRTVVRTEEPDNGRPVQFGQ